MLKVARFLKNIYLMNRRLADDSRRQADEGYEIKTTSGLGPERYITYSEDNRELDVLADFTIFNDVRLFADSLRSWNIPNREELTDFDYQKVLNRVVRYLSIWGPVTVDDSKLLTIDDFEHSLNEAGIEFEESSDGVIKYKIDATKLR